MRNHKQHNIKYTIALLCTLFLFSCARLEELMDKSKNEEDPKPGVWQNLGPIPFEVSEGRIPYYKSTDLEDGTTNHFFSIRYYAAQKTLEFHSNKYSQEDQKAYRCTSSRSLNDKQLAITQAIISKTELCQFHPGDGLYACPAILPWDEYFLRSEKSPWTEPVPIQNFICGGNYAICDRSSLDALASYWVIELGLPTELNCDEL